MKNKNSEIKKIGVTTVLVLAILNSSCTTTETQKRVLTEPMSADLEARVMRETGISGAAIGAASGALLAGGSAFGLSMLSGASAEQSAKTAAVAGAAGAVAGGVAGYGEGKRQGRAMVGQALNRDQAQQLLQGAKQYNRHLAKVNSALKQALLKASSEKNAQTRSQQLKQIQIEANSEIKLSEARIKEREKALNSDWSSAPASRKNYEVELANLRAERDQVRGSLKKSIELADMPLI
jgi:hypothetical protein